MTAQQLNTALPRLRRSLGLEEGAETEALTGLLEQAEERICAYLNRDILPEYAVFLTVEMAMLGWLRQSAGGKTSESYTEGDLSQSESYLTPAECSARENALLAELAPYRRVAVKGGDEA